MLTLYREHILSQDRVESPSAPSVGPYCETIGTRRRCEDCEGLTSFPTPRPQWCWDIAACHLLAARVTDKEASTTRYIVGESGDASYSVAYLEVRLIDISEITMSNKSQSYGLDFYS